MTMEEATIETLRRWSHILLWVSIVLPALGAVAAGARYYVERYEKSLSAQATTAAIRQATHDAAIARTELSQIKEKTSPRTLSAQQRNAMLPSLARLKGNPVAFVCRMMDGESCDYATELAAVFLEVSCQVPEPIKTSLNDLPGYLAITVRGKADPEIAPAIVRAFEAAGIQGRIEQIKENTVGAWYPDIVHIIVGRKKP
jgi:hypothetical protein